MIKITNVHSNRYKSIEINKVKYLVKYIQRKFNFNNL